MSIRTIFFITTFLSSIILSSCEVQIIDKRMKSPGTEQLSKLCDTSIYGSDCENIEDFILVKKDELKSSDIKEGITIGGVEGSFSGEEVGYPECSEDGEISCISTNSYRAIDINNHSSKIISGQSILGVEGSFVVPSTGNVVNGIEYGDNGSLVGLMPECVEYGSGCYLKSYSRGVTGNQLKAIDYDDLYSKKDKIKNGFELVYEIEGTQSGCIAGGYSCYIDSSFKAVESNKLISSNIKHGLSLGAVSGTFDGGYSNCNSESHVGCISSNSYPSVPSSLTSSLLASASINGVNGLIPDCSSGDSSCYINGASLKAVESVNLIATNIKHDVSLGGVVGSNTGSYLDCTGSVHTGCIAVNSYPSVPLAYTSYLLATATINETTGSIVDCSVGASSCYINGDSFKAVESSRLVATNIKSGVSLGLVVGSYNGDYSNCSNSSHTGCIATESYPSVATTLTSSLLASASINGSNGEIANCSSGESSCYINSNSFKAAESSLLLASNIKKDVSLGGVTGAYPSSTYKLTGATETVDLVNSNFNSLMVSSNSFEWFDSEGNRYQGTGDSDIIDTNIKNGVDIFGVTGSYSDVPLIDKGSGNEQALAFKKKDGTVLCFGDSNYGGDCSDLSSSLVDVVDVIAADFAFAALKSDGSVVAWGYHDYGGDPSYSDGSVTAANGSLTDVTNIFHTGPAFAALKSDGSVVTWGMSSSGGNSSSPVGGNLSSGVINIVSNGNAFAALKSDGSVVTWGDSSSGGDCSSPIGGSLSSGVTNIYNTGWGAFAALKSDGSVVTWGDSSSGGNFNYSNGSTTAVSAGALSSGVTNIFSASRAFAALKSDGSVVTWGASSYGGNSSSPIGGSLSSGVVKIFSSSGAFAALKSDGSVVTWGYATLGGDSSSPIGGSLSSGVVEIYSNIGAFAALKSDGSVVTWGSSSYGGNCSSPIGGSLSSGVVKIFANSESGMGGGAFAALKDDGSVVTWGDSYHGGDTSNIVTYTGSSSVSGIVNIFSAGCFFIGVREDDSYVVWGYDHNQ